MLDSAAHHVVALVLALGIMAPPPPNPPAQPEPGPPPPEAAATLADPSAAPPESPPQDPAAQEGEPAVDPAQAAKRQQAAELYREGTKAYELGQYPKAAELFEAAWDLVPEPDLLYNLGQAHWRWFDIDPNIDHLRKARTFFQNYDKRMRGREDYFSSEVDAFVTALNTQISAEEHKKAERERPVIMGPSVSELEAAERRRLKREQNLMVAKRLNASGIALIVAGSMAAAVGIGGLIARTANKLVLDNTSGDPTQPSLLTAEEDERRRESYLVAGQVAYGAFIATAIVLPIGIGLRVTGAVIERREFGGPPPKKKDAVQAFASPGSLLRIEF